jgi:hypothetical protein
MISFLKCIPTEVVNILSRLEAWVFRRMVVAGHKILVVKQKSKQNIG